MFIKQQRRVLTPGDRYLSVFCHHTRFKAALDRRPPKIALAIIEKRKSQAQLSADCNNFSKNLSINSCFYLNYNL